MRRRADHDHGHGELLRASAAEGRDGTGKRVRAVISTILDLRSEVLVLVHQRADRHQAQTGPFPFAPRPAGRRLHFRLHIAAVLTNLGFDGVSGTRNRRIVRVYRRRHCQARAQDDGHSHGASLKKRRLMRD